jgi:hypothetical protein
MKHFNIHFGLPAATAALIIFAGVGCGRDNVRVYHADASDAATPTPPPAAAPAAMPDSTMPANMTEGLLPTDNSGQPTLHYIVPPGWEKKALTQMRVASFAVSQAGKQADVSVIPLGGMAGNDGANVNRWRGAVGLPTLAEADIAKLAEKVPVADLTGDLYDLAGTAPGSGDDERIIGVILHREDTSWFFKMTGDAELVKAQKTALLAFLKSVQFGGLAAPSTMDLSKLPPSHPAVGGMAPVAQAADVSSGDKPTWTVPAGWQEGQLTQFLIAKYVIAGDGGATAAVNVSSLAGDGGGLLPNVNRWRAQLGLAPVTDADVTTLPTLDASGGKATLVELAGTDARTGKPAQLVGYVLPLGGQTWFYKLMGDATLVAQQKDALVKFVQSAKYPDAH